MIHLCRILTAIVTCLSLASWWVVGFADATQFTLLSVMLMMMTIMPTQVAAVHPEELATDAVKRSASVALLVLSAALVVYSLATTSTAHLSDVALGGLASCGLMCHFGVARLVVAGASAAIAAVAFLGADLDRVAALALLSSGAVVVLMTLLWRGNRDRG